MGQPKNFRERYPPPWTVEETPSGYCVKAACGIALAYLYCSSEPWEGVGTTGAAKMTRAEGLALAKAIAALAMPAQTDETDLGSQPPTPRLDLDPFWP